MTTRKKVSREPKVVVHKSRYNRCEDICEKVLKEYARRRKVRFELRSPKRFFKASAKKPREDTVYINVWSAPALTRRMDIKKAFGHKLEEWPKTSRALMPSYEGIVICDDDGQELVEVVGRTVYILFSLVAFRKTYVELLLKAVLDKALFWILEAGDEDRARYEESQKGMGRERFVKLHSDHRDSRIFYEKWLRNARKEAEDAQKKLTERLEEVIRWEELVKSFGEVEAREAEEITAEYDRIVAMPKIKGMRVYSDRLVLFTHMIYIPYKNLEFEIGEFEVEIYMASGKLRMRNTTRSKPDEKCNMHHPHVYSSGNPCLGNIKEAFPSLIARREMFQAVSLILQYLETLTLDDWRARENFFYWPLKGESEEERKKRVKEFKNVLSSRCDPALEENPAPLFDEMCCIREVVE